MLSGRDGHVLIVRSRVSVRVRVLNVTAMPSIIEWNSGSGVGPSIRPLLEHHVLDEVGRGPHLPGEVLARADAS